MGGNKQVKVNPKPNNVLNNFNNWGALTKYNKF